MSDHRLSPSESPSSARFSLIFAATITLTALADFLIYGHRIGLGLALFLPLIWFGLAVFRRRNCRGRKQWLLVALLASSAAATAIAPSGANTLVLITITFYASGHWLTKRLSPYWARAWHGARSFFSLPAFARNAAGGIQLLVGVAESGSVTRSAGGLFRIGRILAPALLVAVPFILLLGGGNAILGNAIAQSFNGFFELITAIKAPSDLRVLFWLITAVCIFALFGNATPETHSIDVRTTDDRTKPADPGIAIWRTRLLLITVNIVFFAANTTDIIYLWANETTLPEGVTYSQFVHQGVGNLIASVILAAVVLVMIFRQHSHIATARGQRTLACLWILQNLFLIGGVMLRLKIYVDAYGQSVLRVHVVMFLILVSIGFILLTIRIIQQRSSMWLVGANLLAVFGLFYVAQYLDVRGLVANHNVEVVIEGQRPAADLDIEYLIQLAPESWPALRKMTEHPQVFGDRAQVAAGILDRLADQELMLAANEDWRSWSLRRSRLRHNGLPNWENPPPAEDGTEGWASR